MKKNELAHLFRHYTTRVQCDLLTLEREFKRIMYPTDREFFIDYAWKFIRVPYVWGGDDPMRGFDCSGFVIECLKAIGKLSYSGDWTAEDIWNHFQNLKVMDPDPGALVFWQSSSGRMTHIEIVVHAGISLGAGGGGSKTLTLADAIDQNAYIRARPYNGRGDVRKLHFADPFKED